MTNLLSKILFERARKTKIALQVLVDTGLLLFCFWLAMALRLDGITTHISYNAWLTMGIVVSSTILTFYGLGLYRSFVRFMNEKGIIKLIVGAAISALILFVTSQFFVLEVPGSVSGIYFAVSVLTLGGVRLSVRTLHLASKSSNRLPVAIYGAGEAGLLLLRSLHESSSFQPVFFIDDNPQLQGSTLGDLRIVSSHEAKAVVDRRGVKIGLVAIGDNDSSGRAEAAKKMLDLGLEVRIIPKLSDIISKRIEISNTHPLNISELLSRDTVPPIPRLLSRSIQEKSILVTGAGGSIGSELCRQILQQNPSRLVLLEISEFALYSILEELLELSSTLKQDTKILAVLGSVCDRALVERTITSNGINTVYHAAAYKHVPIVEENAPQAVNNNVIGTYVVADVCGQLKVGSFTLISSDKAVRPTNVMGATKRIGELIVQEAAQNYNATEFNAVRFGNVLGSSGSVIPKFERQIDNGGPITITHEDMTRYFMTMEEAAQLVIQSSALNQTGQIFILDMGQPVKILELARSMCLLKGKKIHIDSCSPAPIGALQVKVTGLRPGEKLYEELLISGNEQRTEHPKIMREASTSLSAHNITPEISRLSKLDNNFDVKQFLATLPISYNSTEA